MPKLIEKGYEISYIGSRAGMEKGMIEQLGLPYFGISSGKLRRYPNMKNLTDAARVVKGVADALKVIRRVKPHVIFSKGGYVTVPVVIAAKLLRVPVVLHESDYSPGLANRITMPFAEAVCCSFPETLSNIPKRKGILTGTPIRRQLFDGDRIAGKKLCGFTDARPVVMAVGGSQGSARINAVLRAALPEILKQFNVVHLCGRGNLDSEKLSLYGYKQFEYLNDELSHVVALADIIMSRSGANAVFEFLALKKPSLLIPLGKTASRGDQILNAESFERQGFSRVLYEQDLNEDTLKQEIFELYKTRGEYLKNLSHATNINSVDLVVSVIEGKVKVV
jgi:UDP-N-acetylglucosamine--N-acetylmuramyl-(pentapeptide) pyrophosphoryl-undecaprenol N-acetylglucosamine transferase